jgi:dTDP-glucose 4,6-dehydratase
LRILLTGGAGFIGSHLCDRLLADGHSVVVIDNLVTGLMTNLVHLAGREDFLFLKHDVSNFIFVPGPVDAVLHFASPASPNPRSPFGYPQLPIPTLKVGALGTHHALGVARARGARYLLASTSEIYGDPQVHPQEESYVGHVDPIGPRSVYDEAKRFAEAITMAYHRYHGLDTRIARIFNTYGPRMRSDDGRAVPNFMTQALAGQPLTVYGSGEQTRSFCYVTDLVDGLVRLLYADSPDVHNPVNLGNPVEMTVRALAELINRMTDNPASIRFEGPEPDDPQQRQPDISRAQALLGWTPATQLETGLALTLEYFRQSP